MSRVTMFVRNDARFDSRVRREAATLTGAGHQVTLVTLAPIRGAPADLPWHDGSFEVVRVRQRRVWLRAFRRSVPDRGRAAGKGPASGLRWLVEWHDRIYGWSEPAGRRAPPSDVYHGHDLDGLRAALAARRAHGGGQVVYDCHDLMLRTAVALERPSWARAILGIAERRWLAQAQRVITVAAPMAAELQRLGAADVLVLPNCSVRWQPRPGDARLLRDAIGVDASTPVAIYHGGLYRNRGIEAMLACVGRPGLEDVRFVFLGYGPLDSVIAAAAERDRRVHLLPAVPPAELCSWLSGADVGVAVCGDSPNHAVTIPNKVFEWLMAGVPMVVSDFPAWRGIVRDDPGGPFGEAVDPADGDAIEGALRRVLAESRRDPALRDRCRRAAMERFNWEGGSDALLGLYRELAPPAGATRHAVAAASRSTAR